MNFFSNVMFVAVLFYGAAWCSSVDRKDQSWDVLLKDGNQSLLYRSQNTACVMDEALKIFMGSDILKNGAYKTRVVKMVAQDAVIEAQKKWSDDLDKESCTYRLLKNGMYAGLVGALGYWVVVGRLQERDVCDIDGILRIQVNCDGRFCYEDMQPDIMLASFSGACGCMSRFMGGSFVESRLKVGVDQAVLEKFKTDLTDEYVLAKKESGTLKNVSKIRMECLAKNMREKNLSIDRFCWSVSRLRNKNKK